MITFDFTRCLLSDSELEKYSADAFRAHEKIRQERESKKVGWWDLPSDSKMLLEVRKVAQSFRGRFRNFLLLGIGGSSNGLKALSRALWPADTPVRLFIQESPDPRSVEKLLRTLDLSQTGIHVVSKSGETIETKTLFGIFRKALEEKTPDWRDHFVVTTEEGDGELFRAVQKERLNFLPIPKNVGGRFSTLSAVGLLGLAVIGVDIQKLLEGAQEAVQKFSEPDKNDAYKNGLVHFLLNKNHGKTISVFMTYGDCLKEVGGWYTQLWAESLGKDGKGQTPIDAQGPQDQHSLAQLLLDGPKDKVVTFVKFAPQKGNKLSELMEKEWNATAQALHESDCPSVTITLPAPDEKTLGELLMTLQIQTAFTGHLLGINPYDQPAVERIKRLLK